jgi:hypothetical protein
MGVQIPFNLSNTALDLLIRTDNEPSDEVKFTSLLGNEVYSSLEFLNPDNQSQTIVRVDTCLISVTQSKNIIKTAIQGQNGTIKEYIALGDYDIEIRGLLVSEYPLLFPESDLVQLVNLCERPTEITVASKYLDFLSIRDIVVHTYSLNQVMATINEIEFQISAWSDRPLTFKVK